MDILPNFDKIVIPIEKFTKYALNEDNSPNKAVAFDLALGYNITNAELLIENIRNNITKFPAKARGNKGYGAIYEVAMILTGVNGRTAKVLTGWIDDDSSGEMRLVSAYVDKK